MVTSYVNYNAQRSIDPPNPIPTARKHYIYTLAMVATRAQTGETPRYAVLVAHVYYSSHSDVMFHSDDPIGGPPIPAS